MENVCRSILHTQGVCKVKFTMPEFHDKSIIEYNVHVTDKESRYDMIIGRDLIKALKLKLDFDNDIIIWNNNSVCLLYTSPSPRDA